MCHVFDVFFFFLHWNIEFMRLWSFSLQCFDLVFMSSKICEIERGLVKYFNFNIRIYVVENSLWINPGFHSRFLKLISVACRFEVWDNRTVLKYHFVLILLKLGYTSFLFHNKEINWQLLLSILWKQFHCFWICAILHAPLLCPQLNICLFYWGILCFVYSHCL